MRLFSFILALWFGAVIFAAPAPAELPLEEQFSKEIRPLLEKFCYDCHNSDKLKGGVNLAAYETYDQAATAAEMWVMAAERIQAFEMPPSGKVRGVEIQFPQQSKLMKFMRALPRAPDTDCKQISSDRSQTSFRGYVMSRRLNREEYENTVRELFGARLEVEDLLPADGGGGEGFDTSGNALFISTIHIENYMAAADRILETILPDKARGLAPELKAARARVLLDRENPPRKIAREHARKVVERIQRLSFRRPAEAAEVDRALVLFDRVWDRGDGFVPAIRLALKSVLVSPNFLFLAETEPTERGVVSLGPIPLASKLSYFLWSSMPDEELLKLAESGALSDTNIFRAQVQRMTHDAKAKALGERFAMQWLEIERLGTEVNPDAKKFPEYDDELRESMRSEVASMFNYVIQNDQPLLELLDADYTFVNRRLAAIYGLQGVAGAEFQKVALTTRARGGVTGMAAVHALTSFPQRTSPVLRGRWVLESLLGEKVPPPPPDVPALEASAKDAHDLPLREQLKAHRANPDCASCHDKMDPLGFGLENFDNLGRWRDAERGLAIDAQGTLPSGESFTGPEGLKKILMDRKDQVMTHLSRKLTGYAYGRELNKMDDCVIDAEMEALKANGYRPSALIEQIVLSYPFRHRFYPKED
jgi:hypothetical protein